MLVLTVLLTDSARLEDVVQTVLMKASEISVRFSRQGESLTSYT